MLRGPGLNIRKAVLNLLCISAISFSLHSQGTSIGGVINEYTNVVAIPGPDNVTLTSSAAFSAGDTVLLIQMKGVVMYGSQDNQYGVWAYNLGSPGSYEFLIIQSVNAVTHNITFTANLANSYDVTGQVQLIKVPYYNSATVTSELTCQPWDSITTKTGGVLALIVGGTLTLNDSINVNGLGFSGGIPTTGDGICIINDVVQYDKYAYPYSYTNSGYKGEGLVNRAYNSVSDIPSIYPDYMKGKGANFNGGGGGNGRYSGGGGGSNIGLGGLGGRENSACSPNQFDGGLRSRQILNTLLEGKMLMGGGGGSSTQDNLSSASAGGSGGGIVIIVCDTLRTNGIISIKANGASAQPSAGNAGAGGGGGAGTIALYQQAFVMSSPSSALKISAGGGNGGNANSNGEGGGGGGGLILTNFLTVPSNVTMSYTGGSNGIRTGGSTTATGGNPGKTITTFTPLLNGFLFNMIHSSVSGNNIDSVCSNLNPPKIIGTRPVGGSGSYTYVWQKSYVSTFASPILLTNDANPVNYTPKLADAITPTGTVWFRRIVRDAGPPAINDTSKAIEIIVQPAILNNTVGNTDTVCFGGNPAEIQQLLPDLIVPSPLYIAFSWQDSSSSGTWGSVISTTKNYDPPSLTGTTNYRRIVSSGSCADTSNIVIMTVLPVISGNSIINAPQDICYGMAFDTLKATTSPGLTGGDNSYRYSWIGNLNGAGWATAPGRNDTAYYDPPELAEKIPLNDYLFRRIVYSGSNDVCFDTSGVVHLRDYPQITNNVISPDNQTICSGFAPYRINGPQPNYGTGVFTYTWQDSTSSTELWNDIPGFSGITDPGYQSPVLTSTTSFRRIASSSACTAISGSVKVIVHPPITNNDISLGNAGSLDTVICNGQLVEGFKGTVPSGGIGGYNYQWLDSTATMNLTAVTDAIQPDFQNTLPLNVTTYYKRQVTSGACISKSNTTITVNVLPLISNNIVTAGQSSVCRNTVPEQVTGSPPAGGSGTFIYNWEESIDGTIWDPAAGINTLVSYQPPVLAHDIWYRRNVISGLADCCSSTSPGIKITINPVPEGPVNAGQDSKIFSLGKTCILNADPPVVSGETGFWTVTANGSGIIENAADNNTRVRNLSMGDNFFVWTITNGLCNIEDSVDVTLMAGFIPQGFSPNYDNINDRFVIEGLDLTEQTAELTILNGAGTIVFTASNKDGHQWVDWDGRNNKGTELGGGTYYYLLRVTFPDKSVFKKSGFVVLKRI